MLSFTFRFVFISFEIHDLPVLGKTPMMMIIAKRNQIRNPGTRIPSTYQLYFLNLITIFSIDSNIFGRQLRGVSSKNY